MTLRTTLLAPALGVLLVAGTAEVSAAQQEGIAGAWTVNHEESDDPREKMEEVRNARGGRMAPGGGRGWLPGGGGGGGRGGRPGGGLGGPAGGLPNPEAIQQEMAMMLRAVGRFDLTLGDSTVTMAYRDRHPLTLYPNGKKWKQEIDPVGEMEFKAEWKGDYLQVERKLRSGMKAKVRYRHFPETDQLLVITEVSGGRLPSKIAFRRVYDRVE